MSSAHTYEVLHKFSDLSFFNSIDTSKSTAEIDGVSFTYDPEKVKTFQRSCKCIACGLEAEFIHIERNTKSKHEIYSNFHINLYGSRKDRKVMLTVDHDILRSMGGADDSSNYNTMCEQCNMRRSNDFETCADFLEHYKTCTYEDFEAQILADKKLRASLCISHVSAYYRMKGKERANTPEAKAKRAERKKKKLLAQDIK